jgi:N-methylhydantoinase A
MYWIGIDVGGTFTDVVLYDSTAGRLSVLKTPSTPSDQSEGILRGVSLLGIDFRQIVRFGHGSTVATNTALERNGARTAVVVTRGHRDILIVGRGNRTQLYNIKARQLEPIVRRDHCFEITERVGPSGEVLTPLDESDLERVVDELRRGRFETVAVCFLHSYANADHEHRVARRLRQALPEMTITASHEIVPEYREHERFFTTALNAYVGPRVRKYLGGLRTKLEATGCPAGVNVMTSSGGVLPDRRVEDFPALSMLSGPAAGVIAARFIGKAAGMPNLITYDMGGTSTDVCMVRDGQFSMTALGRVGAFPIKIQQIDINSVGSGGGSIAAVDIGGVLRVGPRSAGAMPGPACYGRGGAEPTVTDANVMLGRLGTGDALGGEIRLDKERATAVVTRLADSLGLAPAAMAEGILRIAVATMTAAIKEISVMRGLDPRDYTLLGFGGAGPLHAAEIADELGIARVLVPPMPGNFSAFGLLVADIRRDFVRTRLSPTATMTIEELHRVLAALVQSADRELGEAGVGVDRRAYEVTLDMRYIGQAFELAVPIPIDVGDMRTIDAGFRKVYEARYEHAPDGASEIVNFRLAAWGLTDKPDWRPGTVDRQAAAPAAKTMRQIIFSGQPHNTPVYDRSQLSIGPTLSGPAVIEEPGASTIVPRGWTASVEPFGSLILERAP